MSLKVVHICFILLSIGLALGFGFWAVRNYVATQSFMNLFLGISSLAGGGVLAGYFFWFLAKMRKINS